MAEGLSENAGCSRMKASRFWAKRQKALYRERFGSLLCFLPSRCDWPKNEQRKPSLLSLKFIATPFARAALSFFSRERRLVDLPPSAIVFPPLRIGWPQLASQRE